MLKIFISVLLLATVIADPIVIPVQSTDTVNDDELYIINGTEAKPGENPHMCSIQILVFGKWFPTCGASIISEEWAITAAHCLKGYNITEMSLKCGTLNRTESGYEFSITEVQVHQEFEEKHVDCDIGLIKIDGKFPLGSHGMNKIVMVGKDYKLSVGAMITVTGWGADITHHMTEMLQTVDVPVVDSEVCYDEYKKEHAITGHMFCAGYAQGGRDSCDGDSGGPAKIDGKLVGLISWGHGCAVKNYPGVYTRVSSLREWIREKSGV